MEKQKNERIIYKATREVETDGKKIIEEKITVSRKIKEDPFVKLYMRHIQLLTAASTGAQTVMLNILGRMDPENIIRITGYDKQQIANMHDVTIRHVERLLRELIERNVLKPLARSVYYVNADIFAYGEWQKVLEKRDKYALLVTYDRENQTYSLKGQVIETDGKKYKTTRKSLTTNSQQLSLELPFDTGLEFKHPDVPLKPLPEPTKGGKK